MIRLHRFAALFVVVALLSACATGPGGDPTFNYRLLDDRDSGLAYAVRFASEIPDRGARAEHFLEIAERYDDIGTGSQANALRSFAEELVRLPDEDAAVSPAAVELARRHLAAGRTAQAAELLDIAVSRVRALPDRAERARVLREVIDLCFEEGDELFDVLRRAVEAVLVIDDLSTRVDILTDASLRYQAEGVRQPANVLIQQAIPAAGNITEPWARAAAFAAVAAAYRGMGEEDRAERMMRDAFAAARNADETPPGPAATFLVRVIGFGRRFDALEVAEGVEESAARAVVLARIAESYDTPELRSSAFILYARAVSAAGAVESGAERAETYLRVAESYLRFEEVELAVIQAANAVSSLARADPQEREEEIMLRIADLFLRSDAPEEIRALTAAAPTAAVLARVSAHVAIGAAESYEEEARDYLDRALGAREDAEEESSRTSRDIVQAAARFGRLDEALAELTAMDEPVQLSEAATAFGYYAMRAGGLTEEQRGLLEEFYREYRTRRRVE
ncbi:MAG: hypothetical protein ACLFM6_09120 [Spirochaetaceae bacterium]